MPTAATRPRNPRLQDAHTGAKRRLDDKMDNRDSGISGTGCYGHIVMLSSWDVDKILQPGFEPEVDAFDEMFEMYPSQTTILDGRTNVSECAFGALFKGVSTLFGIRIVEKYFESAFGNVGSAFQNLRLGSIKWRLSTKNAWFARPFNTTGMHDRHARPFNTTGMHALLTRPACTPF